MPARVKVTLRPRSGQGQVKSGQISKLVVWTKMGVYNFVSCLQLPKNVMEILECVVFEDFWTIGVPNIDGVP